MLVLSATVVTAQQLTQLQYRLTGIRLTISPTTLTVPRGVATQLNTTVTGISTLPPTAAVHATLRGPTFPDALEIRATPNQPIFLPALTQPGPHFLENIRLDIDETTSVRASPALVNINVLDQLLVGAVTSRPLSLDEIQARGIQFDANSFQAFMFTIALTTASGVRNIDLPVLVPVASPEQRRDGIETPQRLGLPALPSLELPNVGVEPLLLEAIDDVPPGVTIPPIPGILVIPGNIAFLNQFFSVFLTVSNRAPDGTPLVVRNVHAEIRLPAGDDGVAGDLQRDPPFAPGEPEFDNPLRVARTAAGRQTIKPVLAAGPDRISGTADDVDVLVPQGSGTSEFLVEGIREGGHVVDIEIRGTLEGLPSGPIQVAGRARGAVVVRDPNFALTFIHPDVVRAGTRYDLTVQIRNTSLVDANLVTVSLDPRNLTGARLADPTQSSQTIPTIRAGESASVTLRLEALRTGRVNATTLELAGETGVVTGRRLSLRAGVSEQGVPLSSDTLILPPEVGLLRERANHDELTARALALIGEAHSIATAPRASLPLGVLPIPAATVVQRAGELTNAARRLRLSYRADAEGDAEPLPEGLLLTLEDLYFDFLGTRLSDQGWDLLYRRSRQARLFGSALADVVTREAAALGLADLIGIQRHWADTESYRADHVTVTTSASGGQVPVTLEVADRLGRRIGGSLDPEGGRRDIPAADVLTFDTSGSPIGQFAVLTRPDASPYTTSLVADRNGSFDLGIVVPDASSQLRHIVFRGVTVSSGTRLTLTIRPRSEPPVSFDRDGSPVPATSQEPIVDGPPEVIGVVQIADQNVDRFGRVVGVLFDKDVAAPTAEAGGSYSIGPADIAMIPPPAITDRNAVLGGLVQPGGRIVLVGLRDPVGPLVDRAMNVSGVRDLKNQVMVPHLAHAILPDPDLGNGALVTGRVLRADGTPVANAEITYMQLEGSAVLVTLRILTVKPADAEGRYALDFVLQNSLGAFRIKARDPATGEEGMVDAEVRAGGERLSLDLVLVGRGTVEGVVRRQNGTPLAGAAVLLTSATDFSAHSTTTDQNGTYRITGVPVGVVAIQVSTSAGSARASGTVAASGATTRIDLTVFGAGTSGALTGIVRHPDGSIAAGIPVSLTIESNLAGSPSPALIFLGTTTTDEGGTFRFSSLPSAGYGVRAIDNTRALVGDARVTVTDANGPNNPASVVVLLAGTGSVSGQILERQGAQAVPVPGALVAGGTQIVTADSQGRYTIPVVPVGVRVIEALNPATGARGSREVTILTAGQSSTGIDIVLAPTASVTGRVISPEGQPVAGQEVVIIVGEMPTGLGGRRFFVRRTQSVADGSYRFDQLEPREYSLTAVRGNEVANGRARLSPLALTDVVDLRLVRPIGRLSGRVKDESGLDVAAQITLKALVPNAAGVLELGPAGTTTSDPDRGFVFSNLFPGPFTVTASSFFSPESAVASGTIPEANPVVDGVVLVLARNTGRLRGCVLAPDGTTIVPVLDSSGVPLPLSVFITSPRLRDDLARDPLNTEPDGIRVDASSGCFTSSIPLPPDHYTIEVTDNRTGSATFGQTGQAFASVQRGADAVQNVRLLGSGSLVVEVVDTMGQAVRGVHVAVGRTTYPNDVREVDLLLPTTTSPLIFDGLTEGPVSVSARVSLDPAVDVGGRDDLRGFGGIAVGAVVRDEQRSVRVVIDAAGVVTGRFVRVDGAAVSSAQVQLHSSGRPMAFALTDGTGGFRFDGVAVGRFQLDGFDAATGRRARAEGHVQQDGQHVILDLRLGPLGTVRGVVLDAQRTEPQGGAEVSLTIANDAAGPRQVTAATDGTFAFESVPGGAVAITALSQTGLSGSVTTSVAEEGQVVDVEVVLVGTGRVEGIVRNASGVPVALADVTVIDSFGRRRTTQASPDGPNAGRFAFDVVPLGAFTVEARPPGALTPGDGGRATGAIETAGQTVALDVTFEGTVTVGVAVSGAVGAAPVEVSLQSGGLFGGRAVPTGVQDGVVLFEAIPRAAMTVSARQQTPIGTVISASAMLGQGDLPPPGGRLTPDVQLALSQVAIVSGLVSAEGGSPAGGARVMLSAGNVSILSLTQPDGRFEFVGVPLDVALRLDAEGLTRGRGLFLGTIDADGNVRAGDGAAVASVTLQLDAAAPRVTAIAPAANAVSVQTNGLITVTFSEAIDPTTVSACAPGAANSVPVIRLLESTGAPPAINDAADLCDDSNIVPVAVAISNDGRTVTIQPNQLLRGLTQHIVHISSGTIGGNGEVVGGVRDLVGHRLEADFTWQFVTRDDVPPRVLTLSPPGAAVNVPAESVVRVTFSEPIAPASLNSASLVVTGPAGPLTGTRELILGNTVAVFTPVDGAGNRASLQNDSSYTVSVAGVVDLAGNPQQPQDAASVTFTTRDTIPPAVASLGAPPGARAGEQLTASATTASPDAASVQFLVDGVLAATSTQQASPGRFEATLTMPERSIQVAARAIDTSGNIGPLSAPATVSLLPDNPPSVVITAPQAGSTVGAGAIVRFVVDTTDDVGVVEVRGAASGVATAISIRPVSPASPTATVFFDVEIPASAPAATLTFAAAARDGKAQASSTATITLNVAGAVLTSVAPATGQQGQTLNVTVTGQHTSFVQGATTGSFGAGVTVNQMTVTSATSAIANVTIAANATPGARTVTLATGAQVASLADGFTVTPGTASVTSIVPGAALQGQTLNVSVTGQFTHFVQGVTAADFGPGVSVDSVTVNSPTAATVSISVGQSAAAGLRTVSLTTGGEVASLAGGFTVIADSAPDEIANSVTEFSCAQGMHNWYYGYYDGPFVNAGFRQMTQCIDDPFYPGQSWWVDQAQFWTSVRATVSMPNGPASCGRAPIEQWAVRRWSSEVAGVVTIAGTLHNVLGGGDFRAHILVDGTSIFTRLVSSDDTTPVPYSVTFPVALGSTVDFAIQPNDSDCNDHAAFTAVIRTGVEPTAPTVTAVSPANGAVAVPLGTVVRVTFSEPVDPSTVTRSTFRVIETVPFAPPLIANGSFDTGAAGWTVADVDPSGGWSASGGNPGGYFILNDIGGATDPSITQTVSGLVAGRLYRLSGQFTSVYSDVGDPSALSFGVEVNGVVLGELRRPPLGVWQDFVFVFTAPSASITLSLSAERNGDDSSYGVDNIALDPLLDGSVSVAGDALAATFAPASPLSEGRIYRVEISGVADADSNQMTAIFRSDFSTAFVVGPDSDGDGYPDQVENEAGSDPQDGASTPITLQPPIVEAVSASFAVLNTSGVAGGDATASSSEAVSPAFSVLNATGFPGGTETTAAASEAVGAAFAVLNTTALNGVTDSAVFIGEAVSPFFVVENTAGLLATLEPRGQGVRGARFRFASAAPAPAGARPNEVQRNGAAFLQTPAVFSPAARSRTSRLNRRGDPACSTPQAACGAIALPIGERSNLVSPFSTISLYGRTVIP